MNGCMGQSVMERPEITGNRFRSALQNNVDAAVFGRIGDVARQKGRSLLQGTVAGNPNQSLRILFLTHYFTPEGNAPASRVYEMCKRWVRDGHQVTVITCAPNNPTGIVYKGYKNR